MATRGTDPCLNTFELDPVGFEIGSRFNVPSLGCLKLPHDSLQSPVLLCGLLLKGVPQLLAVTKLVCHNSKLQGRILELLLELPGAWLRRSREGTCEDPQKGSGCWQHKQTAVV